MKFAERMGDFIGKPFKAGGTGPDGFDCIGLVYAVLRALRCDIPDTFDRYSVHEPGKYVELWDTNRLAAIRAMIRWVESLGEPVSEAELITGDVCLIRSKLNGDVTPAVYAGNCLGIIAFAGQGVQAFDLSSMNAEIIAARRLKRGS
jgi:cell wall-associated NlpC family hydrolase